MDKLTTLEKLENELHENNVDIFYDEPLSFGNGALIKLETKTGIFVRDGLTGNEKRAVILHEQAHLETDSLYTFDTSRLAVKRRETKANDYVVKNNIDSEQLKKSLIKGLEMWEIAEEFQVDIETIEHAIKYYKRKGIY